MTAQTIPASHAWLLEAVAGCFRPTAARPSAGTAESDDRDARRALIDEVLTRSPDAFSSDLDVRAFCEMYGREF